jgi:NAD(P)-dependent dehydrogenase (short-subunit alcohol dehydrogenase family)
MSEIFVITGANGGIGLAVTARLLSQGDRVFATYRKLQEASELLSLKERYPERLELISLDVNSDESVERAANQVLQKTEYLDVLINMAGILPQPFITPLESLDFEHCRVAFETNALGPLRVSRAFLPLLRQSKYPRVVNISSIAGSISGVGKKSISLETALGKVYEIVQDFFKKGLGSGLKNQRSSNSQTSSSNYGQLYAYGISKAALNMLTRYFATEFKREGIICVALNPGWVKTNMGGANAPLTTDESATAIVRTIKNLTMQQTSLFIYNNGKRLRW